MQLATTPNSGIPIGLRKKAFDAIAGVLSADMTPEDWDGLRDGLLKWIGEEEAEPEHAQDAAFRIAMDRDSVREYDRDGRMRVSVSNISKANVCPYLGEEIPGWQELGLDPKKIYNLFRDPEELKKAAPTLNGVPLLKKHVPVSADDHQPNEVVGSLGTDAEFDGTHLKNSLFVNAREGIDLIESGKARELSAGYHYKPDMTAGKFGDKSYDGVMRDIVFNHVALVEDGRAGPDVVVGDSAEKVNMSKPTRLAAFALHVTAQAVRPLIAMDKNLSLPVELFKGVTAKNFPAKKPELLKGVRLAMDGKLRKGLALDASAQSVKTVLDALEGIMPEKDEEATEEQAKGMETDSVVDPMMASAEEKKAWDAEPIKNFLKEKGMGEDDIKAVCDMLPDMSAMDEFPPKKDDDKKDDDKKDDKAMDDKDTVTKPAMDAAIKAATEATAKAVRETERGIRSALTEVKAWVGELAPNLAFDSGADVYRHALAMRGVSDAKTMHPDALVHVLHALPKAGAKPPEQRKIAQDSAGKSTLAAMFPDAANVTRV